MRFFKVLITCQGSYMLATALWPLLDIRSFMDVTGPKHDIWLVKTVGALLIPVAVTLLYQLKSSGPNKTTAILLGGLSAIAFICIDFYYALNDRISDVYLADGVAQILFLLGWVIVLISSGHKVKK